MTEAGTDMKPGKETEAGKTPNDAGTGRSVLVIPNDEFFAQGVCLRDLSAVERAVVLALPAQKDAH